MGMRKRGSGVAPLIVGVWCTVLCAYAQVGCFEDEPGEMIDASAPDDAPNDGELQADGASDASVNDALPLDDAGGGDVGDFDNAAGSYANDDTGCELEDFTVTIDGANIVANPFGTNGAVSFVLKAGTTNVAEADDLNMFGKPEHLCTMTETADGKLKVDCSNTTGGSCTQGFTKQ